MERQLLHYTASSEIESFFHDVKTHFSARVADHLVFCIFIDQTGPYHCPRLSRIDREAKVQKMPRRHHRGRVPGDRQHNALRATQSHLHRVTACQIPDTMTVTIIIYELFSRIFLSKSILIPEPTKTVKFTLTTAVPR